MTHQEKLEAARALVARIPAEFDPAPVPEAAKALGVSAATVRAWIADGRVRALNVGAKADAPTWRVDRESLARFLAERMR